MSLRWSNDRGEIASWLIIMAGLVTAGALASTILLGTITDLANAVGIGSGDATTVTTPGGGPGDDGPGGDTGPGEAGRDTDGDGIPDSQDLDDDGDGIPDTEDPDDDGDGIPDTQDPDGPGDGPGDGDNDGDPDEEDQEDALDQATIDRLNEIAARARTGNDQSDLATDLLGRELNELFPDDPDTAQTVFDLMMEGATLEQAIAEATGDWSGVPGGDPSEYSDDQLREILDRLGIEIPEGLEGLPDGADELIDLLPDWMLAGLFNEGGGVGFESGPGITTPGGLFLPASASATLNVGATVDLSRVQTGVGFGQTQNVDISLTMTGELSGRLGGRTALNRVYNLIEKLGRVPAGLEGLLERNPLLRKALRGVPFGVAYSEFVGVELAYQATLTTGQATALENGDTSGLPNVFDPSSFEPGNSVLIRGGDIHGSEFEFRYKLLEVNDQSVEFDGLGFGATLLPDGRMAIFTGPIDAIERQTRIGLPGIGLIGSTELAGHDFTYAELDLNTPEGQAAYDAFITGGGMPTEDANGVRTADSYTITLDTSTGAGIDIGPIEASTTFVEYTSNVTTTTFADGESVTTSTFGNPNGTIEIVAPTNGDSVDIESANLTVVLADLDDSSAEYVHTAYTNTQLPDQPHHVQLTFTPADLTVLRERALIAHNRNWPNQPDQAAQALQNPWGFTQELAAAQTNAEVIQILSREHANGGSGLAYELLSLGIGSSADDNTAVGATDPLPGTIEVQPTGG